MKKNLFFLLVISNLIFAKNINEIKNISLLLKEKNVNEKNEIVSKIDLSLPNTLKKTIVLPELNKGEQYIYKNNKKIVYLPIFNQTKETEINSDENIIVSTLNNILEKYKKDKNFTKQYDNRENLKIEIGKYYVVITSYVEQDEYLLPDKFEIFSLSKNTKIADSTIYEIEINPEFTQSVFEIHKSK